MHKLSSNKNYLVSFFVKKTSSCQFQNKKRFFFFNKTSWGDFNCPYKSAILWRHEIGARILDLLILWPRVTDLHFRYSVNTYISILISNKYNIKKCLNLIYCWLSHELFYWYYLNSNCESNNIHGGTHIYMHEYGIFIFIYAQWCWLLGGRRATGKDKRTSYGRTNTCW